eukprot:379937_1
MEQVLKKLKQYEAENTELKQQLKEIQSSNTLCNAENVRLKQHIVILKKQLKLCTTKRSPLRKQLSMDSDDEGTIVPFKPLTTIAEVSETERVLYDSIAATTACHTPLPFSVPSSRRASGCKDITPRPSTVDQIVFSPVTSPEQPEGSVSLDDNIISVSYMSYNSAILMDMNMDYDSDIHEQETFRRPRIGYKHSDASELFEGCDAIIKCPIYNVLQCNPFND